MPARDRPLLNGEVTPRLAGPLTSAPLACPPAGTVGGAGDGWAPGEPAACPHRSQ
ncbi:hypothetical protein GCM10012278_32640 [Nonomuraea glycinis]|uniref:Uncharacterized protein n=1 Tax=Nonomuraea glycinis TaxID=2047744 RepID=A0A918A4K0_9ACTN|nr:hypothetical protein GCM10012278_32640 [Nonomuraea glycinis]